MTVANYTSIDQGSRRGKLPARSGRYWGVEPYSRRFKTLERQADIYKDTWRALNEFMHPWSGRYLFSESARKEIADCSKIKNAVVGDAARTCASGLHGGLTSPSKPWFEITHPDSEMMESPAVKGWMHSVQEIMRGVLAKSNFYSVMPNMYLEAIIYGTAAAIIDRDDETGIRMRQLTIGEYYLGLGEDLRVDSLYRRLEMTAAQMREKFGEDNPGYTESVRDALRDGNLDEPTFTIIHAMQPIGMFGGKLNKLFKYESVYFMADKQGARERTILLWQGHRSKPFVAVRWATTSDDIYGFSPGMMSLPNDRMLQAMEKDYLDAVEKVIDPATIGPSSLEEYVRSGETGPGGYIPCDMAGNAPAIQPLYKVDFDFNNTRVKVADVVEQIQNNFYNHLFLSILFNTKQMTATEVAQRLEEKAMVLGPVLERFQSELFDPILDRVFIIMYQEYRVIPEPPEEIAGANLKIDYIGSLAQSVKMLGLTNITNTLPIMQGIIELDPSAAKKLNGKEVIDYVCAASNMPPKAIRTDEECEAMEQAEAQAQQQAAELEAVRGLTDAAKTASETPLDNGSLLTGESGGLGGQNGGQRGTSVQP